MGDYLVPDTDISICAKCGHSKSLNDESEHSCTQFQNGFLTYFSVINDKQFQCKNCFKKFITSDQAIEHILIREGRYKIFCRLCNSGFMNEFELRLHYVQHICDLPISCTICNQSFNSQYKFRRHKRLLDRCKDAKFQYIESVIVYCQDCDSVFNNKMLSEHKKSSECLQERQRLIQERQSYIKPNNSQCNLPRICKTLPTIEYGRPLEGSVPILKTSGEYKEKVVSQTLQKRAKQERKSHQMCEECGVLVSRYRFSQHKDRHKGYKHCGFCRKIIKDEEELKEHREMHINELKYQCEICGRKFTGLRE